MLDDNRAPRAQQKIKTRFAMKLTRLLLLAAALTGTAAFLTAGPSPQFANRAAPAKAALSADVTTIQAPAPAAANVTAATCVTCACCKKAS